MEDGRWLDVVDVIGGDGRFSDGIVYMIASLGVDKNIFIFIDSVQSCETATL